jgi:hypothetical protein
MPESKLDTFATRLAELNLIEVEIAVALLWFKDHAEPGAEASFGALATMMHSAALVSGVNRSRLDRNLQRHADTVRGSAKGTYRIRLASRKDLDKRYLPLLGGPTAEVVYAYLPAAQIKGTRRYLERIAWQLNGCYEQGFYDGCAVLCRRLIETLLIECFEHSGRVAAIKNGPDYKGLADIVAAAESGQHIKLARNTGKVLEKVKSLGDTAAHDRTYITSQQDLDHLILDFRRVISELMNIANIHPTP